MFFIGILIIIVSNLVFALIMPLFNIPERIWSSLSTSLGLAYIISYDIENKDSEVSIKMQKIINYIFTVIITFIVVIGASFLLDIIFNR